MFVIEFDDRHVQRAMRLAPEAMIRAIDEQLYRGAHEAGREMKRGAPKATTQLANSIQVTRIGPMHFVVGPEADYAPLVERGSRGGKMPPVQSILDWAKTKGIVAGLSAQKQKSIAWAIARAIKARGTSAQPFVQPVADSPVMQRRLRELAFSGMREGLAEAGI